MDIHRHGFRAPSSESDCLAERAGTYLSPPHGRPRRTSPGELIVVWQYYPQAVGIEGFSGVRGSKTKGEEDRNEVSSGYPSIPPRGHAEQVHIGAMIDLVMARYVDYIIDSAYRRISVDASQAPIDDLVWSPTILVWASWSRFLLIRKTLGERGR